MWQPTPVERVECWLAQPSPRFIASPVERRCPYLLRICLRQIQVTVSPNPRLFQHIKITRAFQDLADLVIALALVEWEHLRLPTIQPARHRLIATIKSQDLTDAFSVSTMFLDVTRRDLECMLERLGTKSWADEDDETPGEDEGTKRLH
jgi:hypothetical protein